MVKIRSNMKYNYNPNEQVKQKKPIGNRFSALEIEEPKISVTIILKPKEQPKIKLINEPKKQPKIKKICSPQTQPESNSSYLSTATSILSNLLLITGLFASQFLTVEATPTNSTGSSSGISPLDPMVKINPQLLAPFNLADFTHPGSYFTKTNFRTYEDMKNSLTIKLDKTGLSHEEVGSDEVLRNKMEKVGGGICDIDEKGFGKDLWSYSIERTYLDDAINWVDQTYGSRELLSFQPDELTEILGEINKRLIPPDVAEAKSRGIFKKGEVIYSAYNQYSFEPDLDQIEIKAFLKQACEMVKAEKDPYDIAAYVHMQIARAQPFVVGNGRTAQLFMNWILTKLGVDPITFPKNKEYIQAIKDTFKDRCDRPFAEYLKKRTREGTKKTLGKECQAKLESCERDLKKCDLTLNM